MACELLAGSIDCSDKFSKICGSRRTDWVRISQQISQQISQRRIRHASVHLIGKIEETPVQQL